MRKRDEEEGQGNGTMALDSGQVALSIGSLCMGQQCGAVASSAVALTLCDGGESD